MKKYKESDSTNRTFSNLSNDAFYLLRSMRKAYAIVRWLFLPAILSFIGIVSILTTPYDDWGGGFFITGIDPTYDRLVNQINKLAPKLGITVLDLYHNPEFKNQDSLYMIDEINPTRAGYRDKWLPVFERKLTEIFAK